MGAVTTESTPAVQPINAATRIPLRQSSWPGGGGCGNGGTGGGWGLLSADVGYSISSAGATLTLICGALHAGQKRAPGGSGALQR